MIIFLSRTYPCDADTYGIYKAVEKRFEQHNIFFMHIGSSMYFSAPDSQAAAVDDATAYFHVLMSALAKRQAVAAHKAWLEEERKFRASVGCDNSPRGMTYLGEDMPGSIVEYIRSTKRRKLH